MPPPPPGVPPPAASQHGAGLPPPDEPPTAAAQHSAVPPAAALLIERLPRNSAAHSVFALISSTVGAGVLALPFAFRQTGWLGGLLCILGVGIAEAYTMCVLASFAERTGCATYSTLVGRMLGPLASSFLASAMLLYSWGSCIAYLIIIGDSFQPLLAAACGAAWWTSRTAVIVVVGCGVLLPCCFPTRLGSLKAVSSLSLYGLAAVVGAIAFRALQLVALPGHSWAPVRAFNPALQFFTALPLIVFGFQAHTNVVTIYHELEDPSPGMRRVVAAGVAIVGVFYIIIALAGYLAFPDSAQPNIILNFPRDWLIQAARACVGLIQVCAYPINHHPARGAVRDLLRQLTGRAVGGPVFLVVEPLAYFSTTLAIALLSELGVVLQLVGGECGAVLIFVMPGALLIRRALDERRDAQQRALHEPLLAGAAAAETQGSARAVRSAHRLWRCGTLWIGTTLVLAGACVAALAIATTLQPRP